jgi:hypothetical protein
MSVTVAGDVPVVQSATTVPQSPARALKGRIAGAAVSPLGWFSITCLLVGTAGGIRAARDWQFASLANESATCPIALDQLPKVLGSWQLIEGRESQLDPEIAKFAGANQHVLREYQDQNGNTASVLVLYGLAMSLFAHTPEICYPTKAYRKIQVVDREIPVRGSTAPAHYQLGIYAKMVGGLPQFTAASHMFLHNGEWIPEVQSRWKMFRAHPGMFKIQIDRKVYDTSTEIDPAESLMVAIAEDVNRRVAESQLPRPKVQPPVR